MTSMTEYIGLVQRAFIDQLGFAENPDKPGTLLEDPEDGVYEVEIGDKRDRVEIKDGKIHCCNFVKTEED